MSAEFDSYAAAYPKILDKAVRLAGDGSDYFAGIKTKYLARKFGGSFSGKVLDFGCGVGLLSEFLLRDLPECKLHGYDPSISSLEHIKPEVYARGKFTARDSELETAYDLIAVSNVMHHISVDERQEAILSLYNRLAPGGHLVIFEHNPANPLTRWVVRMCAFDIGVTLLWPREVRKYFNCAGLHFAGLDYITFFPRWLAWFRGLEPHLAWLPLGAQFAIVGSKSDR